MPTMEIIITIVASILLSAIVFLSFRKASHKLRKIVLEVIMWLQVVSWMGLCLFESELMKAPQLEPMTVFIIFLSAIYLALILMHFAAVHLKTRYMKAAVIFIGPVITLLMIMFSGQFLQLTSGVTDLQSVNVWMKVIVFVSLGLSLAIPLILFLLDRPKFDFKDKKFYISLLWILPMIAVTFPLQVFNLFFTVGDIKLTVFSIPQYVWIILIVLVLYGLYELFNKKDQDTKYNAMIIISLGFVFQYMNYYTYDYWSYSNLPLHLCNLGVFFIFFSLLFKNRKLFVFTHYVNTLGAAIAVLIPLSTVVNNILSYPTMNFIYHHSLLVMLPVLTVLIGVEKRPTRKEFVKISPYFFVLFWVVIIISSCLNFYDVNVNYFYAINDSVAQYVPFLAPLRDIKWTIGICVIYPVYQMVICLGFIGLAYACGFLFDYIYKIGDANALIRKIKAEEAEYKNRPVESRVKPKADCNVEIFKLQKTYKNGFKALNGVSFNIKKGEIVGILGHNGAGKSTLIKCLTSVLDYEKGDIIVAGKDLKEDELYSKSVIGYVPDNHATYENLTGLEYINYVADMYGVSLEGREEKIAQYMKEFDLTAAASRQINAYSHGMKQKISLIAAIINEPKVLVLDEPIAGLDYQSAHNIKEFLKAYCKKGNSILFSSHIYDVVAEICDRVVLISGGKIVQESDIKDFKGNIQNFLDIGVKEEKK